VENLAKNPGLRPEDVLICLVENDLADWSFGTGKPSMSAELDLGAYLRRIGLETRPAADLAGLRALHFAHATTIPFENLDIQMGLRILLDLASLQAKLVRRHRGGYCFEHNTLFLAVLKAVGFDVIPCEARVRLGRWRCCRAPTCSCWCGWKAPPGFAMWASAGKGCCTPCWWMAKPMASS